LALLGQEPRLRSNAMSSHPNDTDLLHWAHTAQDAAVGAHVSGCDVCTATISLYRVARVTVSDDAVVGPSGETLAAIINVFRSAPTPAQRIAQVASPLRRIAAAVSFDSWGQLAPGFAGVRGEETPRLISFSGADTEVDVQIAAGGRGVWSLTGQVSGDEVAGGVVALFDTVTGDAVTEVGVDESGLFLADVEAGHYDFIVRTGGDEVVLHAVAIG